MSTILGCGNPLHFASAADVWPSARGAGAAATMAGQGAVAARQHVQELCCRGGASGRRAGNPLLPVMTACPPAGHHPSHNRGTDRRWKRLRCLLLTCSPLCVAGAGGVACTEPRAQRAPPPRHHRRQHQAAVVAAAAAAVAAAGRRPTSRLRRCRRLRARGAAAAVPALWRGGN